MIAGIDDQSLDLPDRPIRGVYVLAAAHLHLTHGYTVVGDRLGTSIHAHAHAAHPHAGHAKSVVGQREHLSLSVAPLSARSGQKPGLFGVLERFELRHRAPQPDLRPR
jgi:hypothetical protein